MTHITHRNRYFSAIAALIVWFALIGQLYLSIMNRTTSVSEAIIRYFGYFTILTNLLVAVYFTTTFLNKRGFFQRPGVLTAITVYITVVGLTYQVLLRHIWAPEGLQFIVNELLHSFIPVMFIVYWVLFEDKPSLHWRFLLPWIWYPLAYAVYCVIRGHFSGFYPYPFVDVSQLGYPQVLINSAGIFAGFFFFSALFIGVGKMLGNNQQKPA